MSMFGIILCVMVYGVIVAITGWMLRMTFRNIAGFVRPVIRTAKIVAPVVARTTRTIARITVPAARSVERIASPYVALTTRRIAAAAAKAAANAQIIKANCQAATRR